MPRPGEVDELDEGFRRVAATAAGGDLVAARTALRRLGDDALAAGRPLTASRALRLSAALDRVLGDPADAAATALRAAELAGEERDLAAAAHDELGEALLALGHSDASAKAFAQAAADAAAAGLDTGPALRRKQAYALADAGRADASAAVLAELAGEAADPVDRAEILVQAAAGAAGTAGAADLWEAARAAVAAAEAAAAGTAAHGAAHGTAGAAGAAHGTVHGTEALRADLAFVAASEALQRGDLAGALAQVRAARRHALEAVSPLSYTAAAVAESSLAEHAGDDETAYGSLATGYATLGDLVGKQLSGSTFEGPLLELRRRWGAQRFAAAKAAYEATRRRALPT